MITKKEAEEIIQILRCSIEDEVVSNGNRLVYRKFIPIEMLPLIEKSIMKMVKKNAK